MLILSPIAEFKPSPILVLAVLALFNICSASANEALTKHNPQQLSFPTIPNVREPILPIPEYSKATSENIVLGEQLFRDKRLDSKNKIACGDCHNLDIGGTDQLAFSVNGAGIPTQFNTPTIYNVALNTQYYWSGKFETLEEQITDAIKEINTTWPELVSTIKSIPEYNASFNNLYADGITIHNIKDVIIKFEQSLLTPNSPFDQYLNGNVTALDQHQQEGWRNRGGGSGVILPLGSSPPCLRRARFAGSSAILV